MNIHKRSVLQTGRHRREGGSVLLIGMIFLVILMVGAVSIMNSSVQDEKISGNTKRSSNAFLAAEGGMHDSLGAMTQAAWYDYKCNADGSLEVKVNGSFVDVPDPFLTNSAYTSTSSYEVVYLGECTNDLAKGFISSLKFQSTGNEAGAEREIVYSMGHGDASFPALYLNDNGSCDFDAGPSNAYNFYGNGGPAVSSGSSQCESDVESAIAGKEDQYTGGVIHFNPAPNFHEASGLEAFYDSLIPGSGACADFGERGGGSSCVDAANNLYMYRGDSVDYHQNHGFSSSPVSDNDVNVDANGKMGSTGSERVYVVHGDFNSTGSIQGAGVLVVTGDAHFGGTPDWEGIIIVLGGEATIGGGGNPVTGFNGTMIISDIMYTVPYNNLDTPPNKNQLTQAQIEGYEDYAGFYPQDTSGWTLGGAGEVHWEAGGGGNATYQYDCNAVKASHQLLTSIGAAMSDFEEPDCSGGSGGTFGNSLLTDWYEIVGS